MKKLLLAVLLVAMFVGVPVNAETVTDYFQSEELVVRTMGDLQYKLPETWYKSRITSATEAQYFARGMQLFLKMETVDYESFSELSEEDRESYKESSISQSFGDSEEYEIIYADYTDFLERLCLRMQVRVVLDGEDYFYDVLLFAKDYNWYLLGISYEIASGLDYQEDFEAFINNLSIDADISKRISELEDQVATLQSELDEVNARETDKMAETEVEAEVATETDGSEETDELDESGEPLDQNADVQTASLERTCIYDGNDVLIYATGIEQSGGNCNIGIYIENNSSINLGFNAHAYSVNGIMTGNNIYDMDCDVAAGKKANTVIEIEKDFFDKYGIESVKYVDILFWAYDNDEYFKSFDTGQVTIKTSAYDERPQRVNGETVYDQGGIKIDRVANDSVSYTYAILNTTGQYLDFDVNNITINDFTSSDIDYDLVGVIVLNDCQALFTIEPDEDFMAMNGITDIENVEFSLAVRPQESYSQQWTTELIVG